MVLLYPWGRHEQRAVDGLFFATVYDRRREMYVLVFRSVISYIMEQQKISLTKANPIRSIGED